MVKNIRTIADCNVVGNLPLYIGDGLLFRRGKLVGKHQRSLWALDNFLKKMWVDDLDHLSGFTINGTNYREYYENNLTSFKGRREREEEEIFDEEKKIRKLVNTLISPFTEEFCSSVNLPFQLDPLPAEWIAEIKKPRSVDELVDFLKGELARITKEDKSV